jgi:hypothetical protein
MRDPYQIPRPAMFPLAAPCRMTMQASGRLTPVHVHWAYLDRRGVGKTNTVASHFHYVLDGKVTPSLIDRHIHGLTSIPCGLGRY